MASGTKIGGGTNSGLKKSGGAVALGDEIGGKGVSGITNISGGAVADVRQHMRKRSPGQTIWVAVADVRQHMRKRSLGQTIWVAVADARQHMRKRSSGQTIWVAVAVTRAVNERKSFGAKQLGWQRGLGDTSGGRGYGYSIRDTHTSSGPVSHGKQLGGSKGARARLHSALQDCSAFQAFLVFPGMLF